MLTFLKALMVFGIVLDFFLVLRKNAELKKTEEGQALWESGKKHIVWNTFVGVFANFFDTLGVGSFATSSFLYKIKGSVDDINVPGVLNVGDGVPVCMEAFLFFGLVEVQPLTLITLLASSTVGAFVGASFVTKWDVRKVRYAMGIGLLLLGIMMACRAAEIGPFGTSGSALKLTGVKLVVGIVVNFFLGALMDIGCGLYAPCLAMISMLGMNVQAAFPIMMGSCACLMAFGNTPEFVKTGRYDMVATLCNMIGGAIGVIIAYYFVKSLPISVLTWIVVVVVLLTSILYFRDARRTPKPGEEEAA